MVIIGGCSSERHNPVSKAFHNTTARYNAYYYAKERIKEIQGIVKSSDVNNFNDILNIYPKFDTTLSNTYKTQTEDCIKKASIAIQIHKNSKWVDDSYIQIGLARYYDRDFVNAIETFKYVNTKSEDDDARHLALVHLIRVFADYGEHTNAEAVIDYLKKETLDKQNEKLLYVNKAYLFQLKNNYDLMVQNLALAAPLLTRSEGRAKIHFIVGQVYQELGFDSEAYNNYKKCIASNPEYELYFYARLNMAQVTELSKNSDIKSVRKHFKKLLSDKKNREFQDKIYYEMAEFEGKQNNIDEALDNYKLSVATSVSNNRQKGMSYHKLGVIYYDTLGNYSLAKSYYDSAIQALPGDFENYTAIKQRQEVLADFVAQLDIIKTQDSLLHLSSLDSLELMAQLDSQITKLEIEAKVKKEKAERRARNKSTYTSPFDIGKGSGSSKWYFDNPSAIGIGQTEFRKKWGNRHLEDHWRRSNKSSSGPSVDEVELSAIAVNGNGNGGGEVEGEQVTKETKMFVLYNQLPHSDNQKEAALAMIEEAYYKLGNLYNFDLYEKSNAANSFETLLYRFPATNYEPEVLYLLYLIYQDIDSTQSPQYQSKLLEKYPNTTYAKLINNPDYTEESNEAAAQQKIIYEQAYKLYAQQDYKASMFLIDEALDGTPETIFTPRIKLLRILIIGKTTDISKYKYELDKFIKENPDSDVTAYAKTLAESAENFEKRLAKLRGVNYIESFDQVHYFVVVYDAAEGTTDKINTIINRFHLKKYPKSNLNAGSLSLNEEQAIILVTDFAGIETAIDYYSKFDEARKEIEVLSNSKIHTFVITKDNFSIFYQQNGLAEYMDFFSKNYN